MLVLSISAHVLNRCANSSVDKRLDVRWVAVYCRVLPGLNWGLCSCSGDRASREKMEENLESLDSSVSLWVFFGVRESPRNGSERRICRTLTSRPSEPEQLNAKLLRQDVLPAAPGGHGVDFGHGIIYYGMPLGLGNLSFDLYLSVTLNALSEFPASLLAFLIIGKLDRKGSVLGLSLLSGACSVCCVLVRWKALQIVLELMSYLSACTAFDIVSIYTLELFPTCVRNSAVAMARQSLVLGGVLGSVLAAVGRKKGLLLSYGVFGVAICICGLFVVCLPETKGRVLCDTMEEEERKNAAFDQNYGV
ncbi:UNVERIFIED_CONTAM: Organic cation/carnitine transporter 3 [Sesamum angustifolium]|uniref:Organic cation/carnitine transporter 3 n=1 Tax=Sesamum angustifolium TaxID=2727405 RepID=A0AAW2PEF3_9LAMI